MPRTIYLALASLFLLAAEDAKKDSELIQGTWTIVSAERGGMKSAPEDLKDSRLVIKGDQLTITDNKNKEVARITLDPSKKPKAIDFTTDKGDDVKVAPGIYELDGDMLKLCFRKGFDRPKEFAGDGDKMLMVLKREKK